MSILKTTNTGGQRKLTVDILLQLGYRFLTVIESFHQDIYYSRMEKKISGIYRVLHIENDFNFHTDEIELADDKYAPRKLFAQFYPYTVLGLSQVEKVWERIARKEKIYEKDLTDTQHIIIAH